MTEITWEDPPGRKTGGPRGAWIERLQPLTEQPKRWAVIKVGPNQGAVSKLQQTLRLRQVAMPAGRFEFVTRLVDGEHRVYGRYLSPDEDGGAS